jgi:hypothetical protein
MNTTDIKNVLKNDPTFMGLVGSYIADDGLTTDPALAMLFQNQQQDSRSVDGLEVVVLRNPLDTEDKPMIYQMRTSERIFQVALIQHKSTGSHHLEAAIDRIHTLFPFNAVGAMLKVPDDSFILGEYIVNIEDSDIDPANEAYDWLA